MRGVRDRGRRSRSRGWTPAGSCSERASRPLPPSPAVAPRHPRPRSGTRANELQGRAQEVERAASRPFERLVEDSREASPEVRVVARFRRRTGSSGSQWVPRPAAAPACGPPSPGASGHGYGRTGSRWQARPARARPMPTMSLMIASAVWSAGVLADPPRAGWSVRRSPRACRLPCPGRPRTARCGRRPIRPPCPPRTRGDARRRTAPRTRGGSHGSAPRSAPPWARTPGSTGARRPDRRPGARRRRGPTTRPGERRHERRRSRAGRGRRRLRCSGRAKKRAAVSASKSI